MKRTEMLNLMAFRIRDIRKYDCSEMDVAIELLDEMVKAGMFPETDFTTFSGTYTIKKFEEEITEKDKAYAREQQL